METDEFLKTYRYHFFGGGFNSGPIFPDVLYPNTTFPPFIIALVFFVTAVSLTAKANALRSHLVC